VPLAAFCPAQAEAPDMGVQWGRRALTGIVGIPTALWLLASPRGMLLLASALCCLCLVEFSGSISPRIVAAAGQDGDKQKQDGARSSLVHRALLVATGAVACVAAASGQQGVSGRWRSSFNGLHSA
jgi:hypothetical protein